MFKRRDLLWLDCTGGLAVGVLVLLFQSWLAEWHRLSLVWIVWIGIANLAYGCFSFSLAIARRRSLGLVSALAIANIIWGPICGFVVWANWETISWTGMVHLIGEGIYVTGLGAVEWNYRRLLSSGDLLSR